MKGRGFEEIIIEFQQMFSYTEVSDGIFLRSFQNNAEALFSSKKQQSKTNYNLHYKVQSSKNQTHRRRRATPLSLIQIPKIRWNGNHKNPSWTSSRLKGGSYIWRFVSVAIKCTRPHKDSRFFPYGNTCFFFSLKPFTVRPHANTFEQFNIFYFANKGHYFSGASAPKRVYTNYGTPNTSR